MKSLLAPAQLEVLAQVAAARALLAFDFDGTLAPIVADRSGAAMRATTRRLLTAACDVFPVAVVSGRSRRDVAARLGGALVKYVVGNHGLEPGADSPETEAALDEARARLTRLVAVTRGLALEDKRYSLAVHYRRARTRAAAQAAIRAAIEGLATPMRMIPGKCVVNVVPGGAPHKGDAVLALRARERADVALYVGDDVTDEDVFRLGEPGRLLTVRVGRSSSSAAAYFVRDQSEIDGLLRRLVSLRRALGG